MSDAEFTGRLITARLVGEGSSAVAEVTVLPDTVTEPECDELLGEVSRVIRRISPRVAIGCGRMRHISSAMLGTLIRIRNRARENGGGMVLFALPPEIQSVIALTRLDAVFPIADSTADAIERLGAGPDA